MSSVATRTLDQQMALAEAHIRIAKLNDHTHLKDVLSEPTTRNSGSYSCEGRRHNPGDLGPPNHAQDQTEFSAVNLQAVQLAQTI